MADGKEDSLYNLDVAHEKNFLGGFESAMFESDSKVMVTEAEIQLKPSADFDIQKAKRDVTELETHLHDRHETALTELDVSCIQAELDRLTSSLKRETKRRKLTDVDAEPVIQLFRKTSHLAETGEKAMNELRTQKGALPPLISAGELVESDDSDEEEVESKANEDTSVDASVGGTEVPAVKCKSSRPGLAKFASEFLGGDYQVAGMESELTYEFAVPTEDSTERAVEAIDSPRRMLFKEESIAAVMNQSIESIKMDSLPSPTTIGPLANGMTEEKNLIDYLNVNSNHIPAEMEIHLEPQVSASRKPFCAKDLTPLQVGKQVRSTATSETKKSTANEKKSSAPKESVFSDAEQSVSHSTASSAFESHWEAPDIADYQLTPSVMDSSTRSPATVASESVRKTDWGAPPQEVLRSETASTDVVETKKVQTAYDVAAERIRQRKIAEKAELEKKLLDKEAVSVPVTNVNPKVDLPKKQARSLSDTDLSINWGGFLSLSPPAEDELPYVADDKDSTEIPESAHINWGGFLSPKHHSREIPLPNRTWKSMDASTGYQPAVDASSGYNAAMSHVSKVQPLPKVGGVQALPRIAQENEKSKQIPKSKAKPKKPGAGGAMVMLQREKKKKKQGDQQLVEVSAPSIASAPPMEVVENLEAVQQLSNKRMSKSQIKKLIGIQSDGELSPEADELPSKQQLQQPNRGELTESEMKIKNRVRQNAISPPAKENDAVSIPQVAAQAKPVIQPHDPNNIPAHFMRLSEITSLPFDNLFDYYVKTGLPLVAFTKEDILAQICKYNKVRPEVEEEELEIPAMVNLVPSSIAAPAGGVTRPIQIQKKPQPSAPVRDGLYPMRAMMQSEGDVREVERKLEKTDSELARELARELNEIDQLDGEVKRLPEAVAGEGDHLTVKKLPQAGSFRNGEFRQGEKVRTKVIGKKGEVWIEAEVFDYNDEDDTWNVRVCEPEKHKVTPMAVHVPRKLLEKIVKDDHVAKLIGMGFDQKVAYQTLEAAHGNLEFALSLLVDNQQNIPMKLRASKVSHIRFGELAPIKGKKGGAPNKEEFDYEVTFTEKRYGFEIIKGQDGRNAIVGVRVSEYAKINVHQGSLVVSVQGQFCINQRLKKIRKLMVKASANPPVTIRFRAKRWMRETSRKHGTLKILVVGAQALYRPATHVTIRVHNALLTTDRVKKDDNPFWNEYMMWKQYHPKRSQHAILKVWSYNRFTSNTCLGKAKVRLPHQFEKLEEQLVKLESNSGNIVGLVMLRFVVSRNPYVRLG